jgi:hypothetical protein
LAAKYWPPSRCLQRITRPNLPLEQKGYGTLGRPFLAPFLVCNAKGVLRRCWALKGNILSKLRSCLKFVTAETKRTAQRKAPSQRVTMLLRHCGRLILHVPMRKLASPRLAPESSEVKCRLCARARQVELDILRLPTLLLRQRGGNFKAGPELTYVVGL